MGNRKQGRERIFPALARVAPQLGGGALFAAALVVMSLSYGVMAGHFDLWPSALFKRAYAGVLVLMDHDRQTPERRALWHETPRGGQTGVRRHVPGRTAPGNTLFSSLHGPAAVLVDPEGTILHEWRVSEADLENRFGMGSERLRRLAFFDDLRPAPDGGLWALLATWDAASNPGGLIRLRPDSSVEWAYPSAAHHAFDVGNDGTLYVLTYQLEDLAGGVPSRLRGPVVVDYIDVVSAGGRQLERISVIEWLVRSGMAEWLARDEIVPRPEVSNHNPLHTNAVRLVGPDDLHGVPDNGHRHVLVSFRNLHKLAIVDLDERRVVRAWSGPWLMQHDPDILSDGTLMVFDNWGGLGRTPRSRVLRVNPATGEVVWRWPQGRETLDSIFRGSQQPLANGNVLITESHGARLIEVAPDGEVVWEYVSPFRKGANDAYVPILRWAQRVDADWPGGAGTRAAR